VHGAGGVVLLGVQLDPGHPLAGVSAGVAGDDVFQPDDAGGERTGVGRDVGAALGVAAGRGHRPGDLVGAGAGLDDDVGEFLRLGEAAPGVDGQLKRLALGHGRLADLPGGYVDVLLADGGDHVQRAELKGRQPIRVEPDAQAEVALAHVADAGDTGDPGQFVLDEDGGVVTEINRIAVFLVL